MAFNDPQSPGVLGMMLPENLAKEQQARAQLEAAQEAQRKAAEHGLRVMLIDLTSKIYAPAVAKQGNYSDEALQKHFDNATKAAEVFAEQAGLIRKIPADESEAAND